MDFDTVGARGRGLAHLRLCPSVCGHPLQLQAHAIPRVAAAETAEINRR